MGFFRRFAEGLGHSSGVAGLAEAAPTWGWEPVEGDPFESGLTDMVHDVARTLHGVLRSTSLGAGVSTNQESRGRNLLWLGIPIIGTPRATTTS